MITPQPDSFGPVKRDYPGQVASVIVTFEGPTSYERAIEWRDEQIVIAEEINSWVDEELKDYDR